MSLTENGSKIRRNRTHTLLDRQKYVEKTHNDCYSLIDLSEESFIRESHVPLPNNMNGDDAPNEQVDPITLVTIPDCTEPEKTVFTTRIIGIGIIAIETDLSLLFDTTQQI